jgi:alpha-beta hydrolase superfamily lysophospholipase
VPEFANALRRAASMLIIVIVVDSAAFAQPADSLNTRNVQFVSHGVTLQGTVVLPRNQAIAAAVVWVDGAGMTKRDLGFAQVIAQRGIAVLTYDKRGVGDSGGVYTGPESGTNNASRENLDLLSDDAVAAMRSLRSDRHLLSVPRGFIGISQAGWIVPMAALKYSGTRFMLLWSGAVETTHEDIQFERLALAEPDFWDHHTHEDVKKLLSTATDNVEWADFDPRDSLARLKIPGLWVYGGRDRNVNVDLSIERLEMLRSAGHPNYSYRVLPDYDHRLGGINQDVIEPDVAWIRENVGRLHRQ